MSTSKKTPAKPEWSKPYCGISYYPANQLYSTKTYWVSVIQYNSFTDLHCYHPGCFSPLKSTHKTVAAAKRAGERYMKKHA